MSEYRHGAYADLEASRDYTSPSGAGTIPVYIGRAPIHQLPNYSGKTNIPILISSWQDGINKIGYTDDWDNFELCEALYAHFRNAVQSVGPIVVINVLSPDDKKAEDPVTVTVAFTRKTAVIADPKVILKTISIEGKVLGADFSVQYSDDGQSVILADLKGNLSSVSVTYYDVDPGGIQAYDIITAVNSGVPKVYYSLTLIPSILCSPGWSQKADVFAALAAMSEKINGHWYSYLNADLDSSASKTIDTAITAKGSYDAVTGAASLFWPMAKKGARKFHASTLATVTMQWVDLQNGNVPYETPSNKLIDIDSMCLADGTPIQFDQTDANRLNAAGIDTMTYWEGSWRLWGPHTMKFVDGTAIDARDVFDCNVRMIRYVANTFQRTYGVEVDKPMTRSRKDTILNDFQAWLDSLIEDGALLLGKVEFDEADNPQSDLVAGNFVFETETTNPVPGKALTTKVRWTADGLDSLFGGDSNA